MVNQGRRARFFVFCFFEGERVVLGTDLLAFQEWGHCSESPEQYSPSPTLGRPTSPSEMRESSYEATVS